MGSNFWPVLHGALRLQVSLPEGIAQTVFTDTPSALTRRFPNPAPVHLRAHTPSVPDRREGRVRAVGTQASCAVPHLVPPCDVLSGCCFFTGPWTVRRPSLRVLRRVAAFCRPLRPVFLLVSFARSRGVGVLGLCWLLRVSFLGLRCPLPSALWPSPPPRMESRGVLVTSQAHVSTTKASSVVPQAPFGLGVPQPPPQKNRPQPSEWSAISDYGWDKTAGAQSPVPYECS